MSPTDVTGKAVPVESMPQFRTFWTLVEQTIDERVGNNQTNGPRIMSVQIPFGSAGVQLTPGYISSIGVDFPCRVVGYTIAMTSPLPTPPIDALPAGGQLSLDIQRTSRPAVDDGGNVVSGHPMDLQSIVTLTDPNTGTTAVDAGGVPLGYLVMDGYYAEVTQTPATWSVTEFNDGDMLHFYVIAAIDIEAGLLRLRLRDLST